MTQTLAAEELSRPTHPPIYPLATVDFSSPDTYLLGHPNTEYRQHRETSPIFWNPEVLPAKGFWGLTRYEDILNVANNPTLFCNGKGYKSVDNTYLRISDHVGAAMSRILPAIDPPEHTVIKKVLSPYFSPRNVKQMEDGVREKARRIISNLQGRSEIDVVPDLAVHLPIEVLADLLGIPEADRPKLLYWTDGIFGADDRDFFAKPQDAGERFIEMFEYGRAAIDERRERPRDDLLSGIANTQVDGQFLDRVQVDGVLAMFIGAGNETTRNVISASLLELWRHPQARQELINNPALIGPATDELLRFITPAIHMRRTATDDTEIAGQALANGEKVVMFYGAANRDPAMFPDPERFDIRRDNARRHLAFGIGIHRCIGALIAQMELRIFLEEFLPIYPNYEITSEPRYLRHNFVHAIKSMDLRLA